MAIDRSAASVLREIRQHRGRSLRAAAADVGVAPSYLSRLERGERTLGPELGGRIAAYYGLDPDAVELAEGRLPADIVAILQEHPALLAELRERYSPNADQL